MYTDWSDVTDSSQSVSVVDAPGFPPPAHPAEADLFARHAGIPGHHQEILDSARVCIVGAGGLGSWTALALARSGIRAMTIIDNDLFDRTNSNRQLMFGRDLGRPKAVGLADNVASHMIAGGTIVGIQASFVDAIQQYTVSADVLIVLVDNNQCRLDAVRFARSRGLPAVFSMLSSDSTRVHTFLQNAESAAPCLWCALPNLIPEASMPCVSASIAGCFASAAQTVFFTHRALMGWPDEIPRFNWRAMDLAGIAPDESGLVLRRNDCPMCHVPPLT